MHPILVINSAPFTLDFVAPIEAIFTQKNIPCQLVNFNSIPENLYDYSGIIISASPRGDDIIEAQLPYYNWLKEISIPVIGSCHGHQLMAVLYGSKVFHDIEAEEGLHSISFYKTDPLLNKQTSPMLVEQHHKKSVSLPNNFELLASSAICKNQIMKHRNKIMYGLQFHIEKAPELLLNFAAICKGS